MIKPNQLIPVQWSPKGRKHYEDLGYKFKQGETIMVKPEELSRTSHLKYICICDNCGKEYQICNNNRINTFSDDYGDLCWSCGYIKSQARNLRKYGVKHPLQRDDIKIKTQQTCLNKYGCKNPMQNLEVKNKAMKTMLYGGCVRKSLSQIKCGELLQELYPGIQFDVSVGSFVLDFVLDINDSKIDIEYDGWYWHTSDEAKRRDLIRDKVLQKEYNMKILRIRSAYLIPSQEELQRAINELINQNKRYTQIVLRDWKESQ